MFENHLVEPIKCLLASFFSWCGDEPIFRHGSAMVIGKSYKEQSHKQSSLLTCHTDKKMRTYWDARHGLIRNSQAIFPKQASHISAQCSSKSNLQLIWDERPRSTSPSLSRQLTSSHKTRSITTTAHALPRRHNCH